MLPWGTPDIKAVDPGRLPHTLLPAKPGNFGFEMSWVSGHLPREDEPAPNAISAKAEKSLKEPSVDAV